MYINHDLVRTLTHFMARSTLVAHAFEWGKLLGHNLQIMGIWTEEFKILKKIWTPGVGLPTHRGNIHVDKYMFKHHFLQNPLANKSKIL